jgi:hypothetical protein
MPASLDHPSFRQPESQEIALWRYMDFTKFVALISSQKLFFSRSDRFHDPFEGSYSKVNQALRLRVYKDMSEEQRVAMLSQVADFSKWVRQWTYISSWHANQYESAAMWTLYAKTNEAVAIETEYKSLASVLPRDVYLGMINYIDYQAEWLPEGNSFYPFMHKRKSFEHEKEVRAIIQDIASPVGDRENSKSGQLVAVDLESLIKRIHISPTAPTWFFDLVSEVVKKYEFDFPVVKSSLDSEPVY